MRRLLVLAALVAVSAAAAPAVHAQTPPAPAQGVNVVPDPDSPRKSEAGTLAELGTVVPGEPLVDAVIVRSSFDEPREVLLYAADAEPAVGGGFGFSQRNAAQEQVGAWLRLERETVMVPPNGSVRVPYTVTVPPGTEGGEYVGAVVAEPVAQGDGSGVQSRTRFAMAVYLRVPGGSSGATPGRGDPDGQIVLEAVSAGFDGNRACPVVRYRNDSQDVVDPVATVRTDGVVGGTSFRQERVGALLPGSSAEVALRCLERPVGRGSLSVELASPNGGGAETVRYTWLPWPFVLALLLMMLLVSALLTTLVRGLRKGQNAQSGDDSADRAAS